MTVRAQFDECVGFDAFAQGERSVDRRMGDDPAGIRLVRVLRQLPALAECIEHLRGIETGPKSAAAKPRGFSRMSAGVSAP